MKKVVRLNESEFTSLVKRIISEISDHTRNLYISWAKNKSGDYDLALSLLEDYFKLRDRLSKKDFSQYESAKELKYEILRVQQSLKDKSKESDANKIYEDKNLLVIAANTWEASCKYAAGTKWCTGSKDTAQYWDRHHNTGTEFIWINKNLTKNDPDYKLSLHIKFDGGADWCNALNNCSQKSPYNNKKLSLKNYDEVYNLCQNFHGSRKLNDSSVTPEFLSLFREKIRENRSPELINNLFVYQKIKSGLLKKMIDEYISHRLFHDGVQEMMWEYVMENIVDIDIEDEEEELDMAGKLVKENIDDVEEKIKDRMIELVDDEKFIEHIINMVYGNIMFYMNNNSNDEVTKFVKEFMSTPTIDKINEAAIIFEKGMDLEETISEEIGNTSFDIMSDAISDILSDML